MRDRPACSKGATDVLEAFCEETDPSLLTKGLGEIWEIERLCIKRYACHVTTHVPVQMLRDVHRAARLLRRRHQRDRGGCFGQGRVASQRRQSRRHHAGAVQRAVLPRACVLPRSARSGRVQRPDGGRSARPRSRPARARDRGGRPQGLERAHRRRRCATAGASRMPKRRSSAARRRRSRTSSCASSSSGSAAMRG